MIPAEVTSAVLDDEFPAAQAWGAAHGWELTVDLESMTIDGRSEHPADRRPVRLLAGVDGYPALPPSWRFVDPVTGVPTAETTPARGSRAGRSSVIHSVGVICAHFSRTAYEAGPHGRDWDLAGWRDVAGGVRADTLAQMLAVIHEHLGWSPGWVA